MNRDLDEYIKENFSKPLVYFLEYLFNVDVATDYEEMKRLKTDPTFFPGMTREEFKNNLVKVILEKKLTPRVYEYLTAHELETQEEVDEFLKTEIWQPLYGSEPITLQQAA